MHTPAAKEEECLVVYVTAPDKASAESMGEILVRERLVACANIVDAVTSLYWWGDKMERANECVCLLKTTRSRYADLETRIRQIHPYDVPCITAMSITLGNPEYLDWVRAATKPLGAA